MKDYLTDKMIEAAANAIVNHYHHEVDGFPTSRGLANVAVTAAIDQLLVIIGQLQSLTTPYQIPKGYKLVPETITEEIQSAMVKKQFSFLDESVGWPPGTMMTIAEANLTTFNQEASLLYDEILLIASKG